jgi:putative transposase
MPRIARIVLPGLPHHITQRGNNGQDVFFLETDYQRYLELLAEQSEDHGLEILAYCLMRNHIHLVAVPRRSNSLARAIGHTHFRYTQHVAWQRGWSGHLWQNRFFSCPMDPPHFWRAVLYVERNPVRTGIVSHAGEYPWSSARAHLTGRDPSGILTLAPWQCTTTGREWQEALGEPEYEAALESIRLRTRTGRVLGSAQFVLAQEKRLRRRLRGRAAGKPRGDDTEIGDCP